MMLPRLKRHPEITLLAALLVLASTLLVRVVLDRQQSLVPAPASAPAPAPVDMSDSGIIAQLQARLRNNPEDVDAYAGLGLAQLQRVRQTGDPMLYTQAEAALDEAFKRDPSHFDVLIGQGTLALARHQFAEALRWGEQARTINPWSGQAYGIIGDAQVELGRYGEAVATIQQMVDTRPDLSSYSRISYLRELHGDTAGAITAMRQAVEAGNPATEETLWTMVQLGHLYFNSGDPGQAEAIYQQALRNRPDYRYAQAGIARIQAAQGNWQAAHDMYEQLVKELPLPEFVIALGEIDEVTGNAAEARKQYDLVRAMQQLNQAAGVDVDLELALFDVDHGADPQAALARARKAYKDRPSIYAADVVAWALYRTGQYAEARRYSDEALRLGTRDAMLHYHAGMIAYAMGDHAAARHHLNLALRINPHFSIRYVPEVRELLGKL